MYFKVIFQNKCNWFVTLDTKEAVNRYLKQGSYFDETGKTSGTYCNYFMA